MRMRIEGYDLPGRSCHPDAAGNTYDNIHVGTQRRRDPVDLVPGDAESAMWEFDVTIRTAPDGSTDFGGPYVQGKRGTRFVYLTWGTVSDTGQFTMFRRAKLLFSAVDSEVLDAAVAGKGTLVARLGLTDAKGNPVCAQPRGGITWTCVP